MEDAGIKRNTITYNAAIQACERGGEWEEAIRLFHVMQKVKLPQDTITYNSLVRACEKGGQWQKAFDFMKQMKLTEGSV